MRKLLLTVVAACIVAGLCVGSARSARSGGDVGEGDFDIYVAPDMIVTSVVSSVTIHTSVGYSALVTASAVVNGEDVDVPYLFRDSRGYLVAKLDVAQVIDAVRGTDSAAITLTLEWPDGTIKSASQTVRVKDD